MQYADRTQETTTSTGTGTITLAGAVTGYRAFSAAFSNGDTVRYAISDGGANFEVGEGIFTTFGTTLSRVTVFASSNSNALVSFAAGSKNVWCDIPAVALSGLGTAPSGGALYRNSSGNVAGSGVVTINESGQSLEVVTANQSTVFRGTNYSASSTNGSNLIMNKARGTISSPTKALSGDQLANFGARGWHEDGTPGFGPTTVNSFAFTAEEDFTSTNMGTSLIVQLCKVGAATANEVWRINGNGFMTTTGQAASAGSIGTLKATSAAHTGQTASTELNDVLFDGSATLQFATGAITTQRQILFKARTYGFVAASTITNAATVVVDKAPVAGTNATITNAYSIWVQAGVARFDGGITLGPTVPAVANLGLTLAFAARMVPQ